MKYLQDYKIAVPVFGVDSRISYQTIRKPTVFEKSLLQLLAKYRNDLGRYSIGQIADEIKASPLFFIDGLRYLMEFNAARIKHGLSLDEGATLTLECFDITEDGKKFLANNALPSSNKRESETHFYHPISRQLVPDKKLQRLPNHDATAIEASALSVTNGTVDVIVEEAIRAKWQDKPNIRINGVNSQLAGLLWDHKSISLDIDANGNLTITSADNLFRQWLDSADKEFLWDQIVHRSFSSNAEIGFPPFNWQDVKNLASIEDVHRLKGSNDLQLTVVRDTEPNGKIPAIYLSSENRVFLQGNVLVLPDSQFRLNESLYALNIDNNSKSTEVHAGRTEIYFGGQPRLVDLALKLQHSALWSEIKHYLLESKDLDVVLFSSVLGVNQAVSRLPLARVHEVNDYYKRMKGVAPDLKIDVLKSKVKALESLSDLGQYQAMFSNQPVESIRLLPSCIAALVERSLQERKAITNMEISPVLSEFSKSYFAVQDMAGKNYFDSGNLKVAEADYRLIKLINSWKIALEKLANTIPSECQNLSVLSHAKERMSLLEEYILSSYSPPRKDSKRIIVIDTNCLMHRLHLLDQTKSSDWLVIPTVVLNELDGLKNDKTKDGEFTEKAKQARKAIHRLGTFKSDRYEGDHLQLLKKNRNGSADAKVLSVAAYYRLGEVLLITEDKNLRNMAHAENIPTQNVNSYLGKQGKRR